MANFSKKLRRDLLLETNERCVYCGVELNGKYEIEHFIPRVLKGSGTRKNLTVACRRCNRMKLDYSLEKFRNNIGLTVFYFETLKLSKGEKRAIFKYSLD